MTHDMVVEMVRSELERDPELSLNALQMRLQRRRSDVAQALRTVRGGRDVDSQTATGCHSPAYVLEGVPDFETQGLFKVGISRNPRLRARHCGARLLGLTAVTERTLHQMLAPFRISRDEAILRELESPTEWFYEHPLARAIVEWAILEHPLQEAAA